MNNNAAARLAPLTRSKTADPPPTHSNDDDCDLSTTPKSSTSSPERKPTSPSTSSHPPRTPDKCLENFRSTIYCSARCAELDAHEAGKSSEAYEHFVKGMYDNAGASYPFYSTFSNSHPLQVSPNHIHRVDDTSPHPPPSPLFISGSDTDSSNAGQDAEGVDGPACSAPKTLEYFRITKGGPDDAWNEHQEQKQRQRRSSIHPNNAPAPLTRQQSNHSSRVVSTGYNGKSSDSLSSLWGYGATEADLHGLTRTESTSGQDREALGAGRRSTSSYHATSDRVSIPSSRPHLSRSNLSQTSLAASPSAIQSTLASTNDSSVPRNTFSLLQSYAGAFPARDSASNSSYKSLLTFPASMTARGSFSGRPGSGSRRGSTASTNGGTPLPLSTMGMSSGTIRAKKADSPRKPGHRNGSFSGAAGRASFSSGVSGASGRLSTDAAAGMKTWDQFGLEEVEAGKIRAAIRAARVSGASVDSPTASSFSSARGLQGLQPGSVEAGTTPHPLHPPLIDVTPRQSLEKANGVWKVRHNPSGDVESTGGRRSTSRESAQSMTRSDSSASEGEKHRGLDIPNGRNSAGDAISPGTDRTPLPRYTVGGTGKISPSKEVSSQASMPPPSIIPRRPAMNGSSSTGLQIPLARSFKASHEPVRPRSVDPSSGMANLFLHSDDTRRASYSTRGQMQPLPPLGWENAIEATTPVRGSFNWGEHERKGGKVYELPDGLKIDRKKAGLFYFV